MSLEYYEMRRLLQNIVGSAEEIPDPRMAHICDCYSVPLDDIDNAVKFLAKTNRQAEVQGEKQ